MQRPTIQARSRSGDAAYHITEECERLFCETLKAVFLVEKDTGLENSLVMDVRNKSINAPRTPQHTLINHALLTPTPSPGSEIHVKAKGMMREYVEMWDYVGGARFRGFVVEKDDERSMFAFFDNEVIGTDLKPG